MITSKSLVARVVKFAVTVRLEDGAHGVKVMVSVPSFARSCMMHEKGLNDES